MILEIAAFAYFIVAVLVSCVSFVEDKHGQAWRHVIVGAIWPIVALVLVLAWLVVLVIGEDG